MEGGYSNSFLMVFSDYPHSAVNHNFPAQLAKVKDGVVCDGLKVCIQIF